MSTIGLDLPSDAGCARIERTIDSLARTCFGGWNKPWRLEVAAEDIIVTDRIRIPEKEIQERFVRASGPGGQNVNRVATAVQLRFDAAGSPSLPEEVRRRLMRLAGSRLTREGVLVIEARRHRTQEQNRKDALERLTALIRKASERRRPRKPTRPTLASRRRRLDAKTRKGRLKRLRGPVRGSDQG